MIADLMDPLKRLSEGNLSKAYGIHGFVMMHYWFSDHAVMDETLQAMLKDDQPDTNFCLMWANEAWTRRCVSFLYVHANLHPNHTRCCL